MIVSASRGMPGRPSRSANSPSFITPERRKIGIFEMMNDRAHRNPSHRPWRGASPAHCATDRAPSVKATAPASSKQADLGDLGAFQAFGQRRRRQHPNAARVAGAAQQKIDDRRIVDRRIGVGRATIVVTPPAAAAAVARRDRLAMLGTGLADESAKIDEARRDDIAAAIDDLRMRRQSWRR